MRYLSSDHIATVTTTLTTRSTHTTTRRCSCTVSLFAGIIVGNSHHCAGAWTSLCRVDTVKVTRTVETRVYGCVPTTQSPACSHSSSSSHASKRTHERDRGEEVRQQYHRQRQREREKEKEARQQQAHRQRQREREQQEEARQQRAHHQRQREREQEEEARQQRAYRQRQREREQEEARRLAKAEADARAREIANAWSSYETRWTLLNQAQSQRQVDGASITFERIPWPVADSSLDGQRTRRALEENLLRPDAIREFLLSPVHSHEVSARDRIRAALRRWHPDKLVRLRGMVVKSDRDAVADGVGIVVRCLNEMLERENRA